MSGCVRGARVGAWLSPPRAVRPGRRTGRGGRSPRRCRPIADGTPSRSRATSGSGRCSRPPGARPRRRGRRTLPPMRGPGPERDLAQRPLAGQHARQAHRAAGGGLPDDPRAPGIRGHGRRPGRGVRPDQQWLHRIIGNLPNVGRVHIGKWGDGAVHLHVWFMARTAAGQPGASATSPPSGTTSCLRRRRDVWRADLARIAAAARQPRRPRAGLSTVAVQQAIRKAVSPAGVDSVASTPSTRAPGGPVRHHPARPRPAPGSPSNQAATEPSGSLRTQPRTPWRSASSWHAHRKLHALHPAGHPDLDRDLAHPACPFQRIAPGRYAAASGSAGDDLLDAAYDGGDLVARRTGERERVGHQRVELRPGQAEPLVGGEPVEQVVVGAALRASPAPRATACSLIASCATSRPTPLRTAAISTLVVARNGR